MGPLARDLRSVPPALSVCDFRWETGAPSGSDHRRRKAMGLQQLSSHYSADKHGSGVTQDPRGARSLAILPEYSRFVEYY